MMYSYTLTWTDEPRSQQDTGYEILVGIAAVLIIYFILKAWSN